jgi:hypothetical protein
MRMVSVSSNAISALRPRSGEFQESAWMVFPTAAMRPVKGTSG